MEDASKNTTLNGTPAEDTSELLATLWTDIECARQLGIRRETLIRWHRRRMPAPPRIKLGVRVFYRPADVHAWLAGLKDLKHVENLRAPSRSRRKPLANGE